MPYVSDAQRRFFHSGGAKKAGITKDEVKEFDSSSKGMDLPERAGMAHGGYVAEAHCPQCGYSFGGDVPSSDDEDDLGLESLNDDDEDDGSDDRSGYASAIKRSRMFE